MSKEKQMVEDLIEIFDEEYEKRRLITPQNTAEKMTAKGYCRQSENVIELPCKVGDTVWVCNYHNGNVYENRVDGIYITGASGWRNTLRLEYKNRLGEVQYRRFAWKQIGKTVFLTQEEAEAKMKGGE